MVEIILKPRKTTVLDLTAYTTKVRVNLDYYEDEGTQLDTGYLLVEGKGSKVIINATLGLAAKVFTIRSLNLKIGEVYSIQVRRKNETDWGLWSLRFRTIVALDAFTLPGNVVKGEPINDVAQPVPTNPDFIGTASLQRDLIEHRLQTGHLWRRMKHTAARYSARMRWVGLTLAQKNTLVTFLEARADAVEPFETSDFVHGTRRWFVRRGEIHEEQLSPTKYGIQIEADESKGIRFWTVGRSTVGGPDAII